MEIAYLVVMTLSLVMNSIQVPSLSTGTRKWDNRDDAIPQFSRCQKEELVCENGGSCWDKPDGSSKCVCFDGYRGLRCEYSPGGTDQVFGCPNDKIALKSYHGKYVVAESDGAANANRAERDYWEIFTVEKVSFHKIALRSHHGKYLVAEDSRSGYEVNANRDTRGGPEVFEVLFGKAQNSGTVAFKTVHGRYLVAESDGRLRGDRTSIREWETFTPECIKG